MGWASWCYDDAPDRGVGRFLQYDPVRGEETSEQYLYVRNRPTSAIDPDGQQSREQAETIASQLGIKNPETYKNEQTKLIKEIQEKLGFKNPDGQWGNMTYDAYQKWAKDNNVDPVALAKPISVNEVTEAFKKCLSKYCTGGQTPSLGVMVAIAYGESNDVRGRGGLGVNAEFNAMASPFARHPGRPTAVGLMQFNEGTIKDLVTRAPNQMMELLGATDKALLEAAAMAARTDPEASACMAAILINLDITREKLPMDKVLSRRWETYTKNPQGIEAQGAALNKAGIGQPGLNAPLMDILRKGPPK